jgi:hypothetical protein
MWGEPLTRGSTGQGEGRHPRETRPVTAGPPDGVYTDAELAAAWEEQRDDLLDLSRTWSAPWAFFRFDCGLAEVLKDAAECERLIHEYERSHDRA